MLTILNFQFHNSTQYTFCYKTFCLRNQYSRSRPFNYIYPVTYLLYNTCILFIDSWLVDNTPIRVFENNEAIGVPFPTSQPMKVYSTIWCGEEWATQGGRVKTNWTLGPFTAAYRNYKVNACVVSFGSSSCGSSMSTDSIASTEAWQTQELGPEGLKKLRWVQKNYMGYNYCTDKKRFPKGYPLECTHSTNTQ